MRSTIALLLMLAGPPAQALDAACETYLAAADKSASQPARHTVTDPGEGPPFEAIVVDGKFFSNLGGTWQPFAGGNLLAAERSLVASIRAGRFPITGCRASTATFDGRSTTMVVYRLQLSGAAPAETRAYIGADGLVYGQVSGKTTVRHRYVGVKAPAP